MTPSAQLPASALPAISNPLCMSTVLMCSIRRGALHPAPACSPCCPLSPPCSGLAFNTGLFAARNVPAARAVLREWAGMLVDPTKEQADDPMHRGIDDQLALNNILDSGGIVSSSEGEGWPWMGWGGVGGVEVEGGQGICRAAAAGSRQRPDFCLLATTEDPSGMPTLAAPAPAPCADDPRTILANNRTLRVQTLPVLLFANGHVAFVQRTPWRCAAPDASAAAAASVAAVIVGVA